MVITTTFYLIFAYLFFASFPEPVPNTFSVDAFVLIVQDMFPQTYSHG